MALQLLQWNARGILAHRQEFYQLLSVNTFDIICLQESFLKPNKEYCPPGYNSIRSDRHAPKGGLVTFIRLDSSTLKIKDQQIWNVSQSLSTQQLVL